MATIQGTLAYVKLREPSKKYQSEEKEYSLDLIVDEDTADSWNENFPKQSAKVVKTSDFETIYKIPAPYPEAKKQYVVKLKKPAQYKDGTPVPKQYCPKVLQKQGEVNVDITDQILVANGSKGVVSYEVTENSYGSFARLRNLLVTDLIEYKQKDSSYDDEFGAIASTTAAQAGGDFDDAPAEAKPAPRKQAAKKAVVEDDDIPF